MPRTVEGKKELYNAKNNYLINKFNYYAERKSPKMFLFAARIVILSIIVRMKYRDEYLMNKYTAL